MDTKVFERRRENLKRLLVEKGIPALLVSHAANRYYLSGFELHDPQCNESAGWVVVTARGDDHLFTDPRYIDAALKTWPEATAHVYTASKHKTVASVLESAGVTAMGFEPKALNLFDYDKLKSMVELKSADNVVEELRIVKDEEELRRMQASIELNHRLFRFIEGQLEPGKTEEAIAWEVERYFRENGAEELAFSTIVGVGPNAALPHAIPGQDVVREDELVLIDTGCRYDDYNSDQTRTFWVGDEPSERFQRTKALVKEAQQAAIDVIRPGVTFAEAYQAAYGVFEREGVEKQFTHGLGHGIGLETHEPPSLGRAAKGELKPGMVVTVEPGLYDPEWGGIRWEYQVVVTEDGCRIM